ncbi:unnamed protein product [Rotaria magnacalcarata]|uniref:Uncharacterized protein n=1 Tax=Rotaria magnacalcarata TaxID=392030 RepID=A0A8S2UZL0_9BILA|nr:unnamed protein product [Rotaria magnacalcarata]
METKNCSTAVEEHRNFILFTNDKIAYDTMVNEADQYLEDKQSHLYIENDDEQKNGILLMKHEDEVSHECEIDDILQCNLELNEQQDKTLNGGNEREYDEIDIAVCLITIKTRYSLTFECVNGVRKLFIALKVKNVPSSIYHIRELVNTNSKSTPTSSTKKGCTTSYKNYTVATISMSDIYHGNVYRSMLTKIQLNKTNLSLTLMMNVDGVAIGNNTEEPLWIITFTINEIKRGERFRTHNIIIGGVWSCYTKSNRKMMQFLLKSIVEQLKQLQKRHLFQVKACNNEFKLIQMYLIDACNDKPANSLVQNIAEPIGKYSCIVVVNCLKRLMILWIDSKYRTQQWSIRQHMTDLETDLRKFRFPSTTTIARPGRSKRISLWRRLQP